MKVINVVYVPNIEKALAKYLKEGYTLDWIEKSAEVEVRFYLQNIAESNEYVCLARQYWDELYPETIDDEGLVLPKDYMELRCHSEKEYEEIYHAFKKLNMVESIPEGENLEDVPAIRLKNCSLRVVHPEGYTWS